ncbi:hypothetical protein FACS189421_03380 [Bacteroidia bacterium]|nr:hypothetical protein FACS189421_03380 [Bacteroidia bacterium]
MKIIYKYILTCFILLSAFACGDHSLTEDKDAEFNEGNPMIETISDVKMGINSFINGVFPIWNTGDGFLIWEITECPEWITMYDHYPSGVLTQKTSTNVYCNMLFNAGSPLIDNPTGRIVIKSNAKNQSETIINISFDAGFPSLLCEPEEINFGRTDDTQIFGISTTKDLLFWEITECPEWITLSATRGNTANTNWFIVQVKIDRSRLPDGESSGVIVLKTNDKNNPYYPIPVKCQK